MAIFDKYETIRGAYDNLRARGIDPFNVTFDEILSPTEAMLEGRRMLLLGTNNYLGLTFDEHCMQEAQQSLEAWGTGTTGSRIANGSYRAHRGLEQRIARFFATRDAMVFSTGYMANLGVISAIAGHDDHLLIDADSHASIYDGCKLGNAQITRFRHNDPDDLARRLRRLDGEPGSKVIIIEGIYSMLGDVAPLREIAAIKREFGAYLLVDEAHSLGVLGAQGRGLAEQSGVEEDVDFIVGTFSKSVGTIGGFCASNVRGFEVMRIASRPYMFTASLPPSVIATATRAFDIIANDTHRRARLWSNATRLHRGLEDAGFSLGAEPAPIVAMELPSSEAAVAFWLQLMERGVYSNLALPPATPGGKALLRSSVSAAHTADQIDAAIAHCEAAGRTLGVLGAGNGVAACAAHREEAKVRLGGGLSAAE